MGNSSCFIGDLIYTLGGVDDNDNFLGSIERINAVQVISRSS